MTPEAAILLVVLVGVLVVVVARGRWQRLTIYEYQQVLRYRNGQFAGLIGPGRHWIYRPSSVVRVFDMRTTNLSIPGQEVIAADGMSVRVSLAVQQRLVDPQKAVQVTDDYAAAVYTTLQVALRETIAAHPFEELMQQRETIGPEVMRRSADRAAAVGVELMAVDAKDFMLSAASRRAFAQVVEARQQGLAALEKARGETAALRSLANAARLIEANPALLQLRWMQQLDAKPGNTVILDLTSGSPAASVAARRAADRTAASQVGESSPPGADD